MRITLQPGDPNDSPKFQALGITPGEWDREIPSHRFTLRGNTLLANTPGDAFRNAVLEVRNHAGEGDSWREQPFRSVMRHSCMDLQLEFDPIVHCLANSLLAAQITLSGLD